LNHGHMEGVKRGGGAFCHLGRESVKGTDLVARKKIPVEEGGLERDARTTTFRTGEGHREEQSIAVLPR